MSDVFKKVNPSSDYNQGSTTVKGGFSNYKFIHPAIDTDPTEQSLILNTRLDDVNYYGGGVGTPVAIDDNREHVRDYGAAPGNDPRVNQAAILQAITAASAAKGTVVFDPGVYEIGSPTTAGSGPIFNLTSGFNDVTMVGAGRTATTLIYEVADYSSGSDPHMFSLNSCNNWQISNIRFDGNFHNHTGVQEQMHIFNVVNCDNIQWHNCIFTRSQGDGIKFLGNGAAEEVTRIQINACAFLGCKRAGVVMQRQVSDLVVNGCIFDGVDEDGIARGTDQVLDYEPTSPLLPSKYHTFTGNIFKSKDVPGFGVGFGGGSSTHPLDHLVVAGNIFVESNVRFFKTRNAQIENNVFIGPASPTETLFDILSQNEGFKAIGNRIESNGDQTAVNLQQQSSERPGNIDISHNTIIHNGNGVPVKSENGFDGGIIANNRIVGNATMKAASLEGIRVRDNPTTPGQSQPILIKGNIIENCYTGVAATSTDDAANGWEVFDVSGNTFKDCDRGVVITAIDDTQTGTLLIDNNYSGTTTDIVLSGATRYKVSSSTWAGDGVPDFTANEGDLYQRKTAGVALVYAYNSGIWTPVKSILEAVVAEDLFEVGSNTVLSSRTLDTFLNGTVWSLSTAGNFTAIASLGEARTATGGDQAAYIDLGMSDFNLESEVRLVTTSSFGGLAFRYLDDDNFLAAVVNGTGTEVRIVKKELGSKTTLASQTGLSIGDSCAISVRCNGPIVTAKIGGVQLTAQETFNESETNVGILSGAANRFYFDSFKAFI